MDKMRLSEYYVRSMGLDSWHVGTVKDPTLTVTMNDGPCGVRKPFSDAFEQQGRIMEATCVPSPSALAASFDREACHRVGTILAKDCISKNVDILLAPGVNIKRTPLCGRNFVYWSEDPLLAGTLAAEYVRGLEDNRVSACVKHYAANNKEWSRLICSSEMSLRTLNEIYLRSFSILLSRVHPTCVMSSYNPVNGEYTTESDYLLNKKLRGEFGFKGVFMSDWGAINDKCRSLHVGTNFEMPISSRPIEEFFDGLEEGIVTENDMIRNDEVSYNALKGLKKPPFEGIYDKDAAHLSCIKAADETPVLLKNDGPLPLKEGEKVLIVGKLADLGRFVGGGSAYVNAFDKRTFIDLLEERGVDFRYVEGYDDGISLEIKDELRKAKEEGYAKAVFFSGTLQGDEAEESDRPSIELREEQTKAANALKEVYGDFVTVLITGAVLDIEKLYSMSGAMLLCYLSGEAQKEAIFDNLYGIHNPCGRLPETWISSLDQSPLHKGLLKKNSCHEYYDEDIFVGYRGYLNGHLGFMLPFGYGLSYTLFEKTLLGVSLKGDSVLAKIKVRNIGERDGSTIVELFTSKVGSKVYRPKMEFKGYAKVFLKTGESREIDVDIPIKDLSVYSYEADSLKVEGGVYDVILAEDAFNVIGSLRIDIGEGDDIEEQKEPVKLIRSSSHKDFDQNTVLSALFGVIGPKCMDFFSSIDEGVRKSILSLIERDKGGPLRLIAQWGYISFKTLYEYIEWLNSLPHEGLSTFEG